MGALQVARVCPCSEREPVKASAVMANPVAYIAGFLSALAVLIAAAARLRYRSDRRAVLVRQARLHRADKLLDALSGTLRATANPDAAAATSLDPESDTLVRTHVGEARAPNRRRILQTRERPRQKPSPASRFCADALIGALPRFPDSP